jgi:rfaE bifunctional protein nucleotidyltransferase chain/domain
MKTVLVGGCFDVIHFGHVAFLEKAKSYGDRLAVALESDESVRRMKGEKRPIHTQKQRQEMLEALTVVDEVIPLPPMRNDQDYHTLVTRLHPAVIAVTAGDPIEEKKRMQAAAVGAQFVVIPKVRTPSTSQLAKLLGLE